LEESLILTQERNFGHATDVAPWVHKIIKSLEGVPRRFKRGGYRERERRASDLRLDLEASDNKKNGGEEEKRFDARNVDRRASFKLQEEKPFKKRNSRKGTTKKNF